MSVMSTFCRCIKIRKTQNEYHFTSIYIYIYIQGGPKKTGPFFEVHNFLYNDLGRQSIYQNVQLFIRSKNDILNAAVFKHSLHKVRETTLH